MQARVATYRFTGDAEGLGRRAETGILPILRAQSGFKSYSVAIGDGKVLSVSAWDTRGNAEKGSAAVADWVAENMTEISLIDVHYGEVMFDSALGISMSDGASS